MSEKKSTSKKEKVSKEKVVKAKTVECDHGLLRAVLKTAVGFVEKKATLPIISHIHISADGKHTLTVSATNLDMAWSRTIKCKGHKVSRCIPAVTLLKEVEALDFGYGIAGMVTMVFQENSVSLNSRCDIYTLPSDDYPVLPTVEDGQVVTVSHLAEALKKVLPSVGASDTRYTLNGVLMDFIKHKIVGTDGHRLHWADACMTGVQGDGIKLAEDNVMSSAIIPKEAAVLIARGRTAIHADLPMTDIKKFEKPKEGLKYEFEFYGQKVTAETGTVHGFEGEDDHGWVMMDISGANCYRSVTVGAWELKQWKLKDLMELKALEVFLEQLQPVTMQVGSTHASLQLDEGLMVFRLISGTYPDYEQVIPKKNPVKVTFSKDQFLDLLKGATPLAAERTQAIKLTINGKLVIESQNPELGSYKWQLAAKTTGKAKDAELVLGVNAGYIIDAVKAFADHEVEMHLNESLTPIVITSGKDGAVVMPMRT